MKHRFPLVFIIPLALGANQCDPVPDDTPTPTPTATPAVQDLDGDGYLIPEDCDDSDASVYPGAQEVPYDGIDQDCDGQDLVDVDQDGYSNRLDCDDGDPNIHPGAEDIPGDGVDQDCDGQDAQPQPVWTCDESWYGGSYCDCGCGILDPKCSDATVDACEYYNCPEGEWPDADANYRCHPIECGNAQLDPGEECDDGNTLSGDGCDAQCDIEWDGCEPMTIRIMAANLTSGDDQSYDPGEGIRIFQGLQPDIVLIQEFNYGNNTIDDLNEFVITAFGESFYYAREVNKQIPNGVISRWPIVDGGYWNDTRVSNREFVWARIDLPGPTDLWAVSVHFLTTSSGDRASEAYQLVNYIQEQVPAGDFLVIGGDLNTNSDGEQAIDTLEQVVSTAYRPVDGAGNPNTNESRSKPYDWVLPNDLLEAFHTSVVIGSSTYPTGLVFDSRVYEPLSEVYPVQYNDSGAPGMQHMGVVRDFAVPTCE